MTVKSKSPQIRFMGFADPWQQCMFCELYQKVSRKNDLTYGRESIISVANMYFKPDSYITEESYLLTYNIFELGDIAFEGNKSKNYSHGRFVENTIGNGIVSHVFDVFHPIMKPYDLQFWKYAINNERIMGKILARCTKASTMMTNLVADDFLRESILLPKYAEQERIGTVLLRLDNLITIHQRKYEKLINVKKSLLEKMFPCDGENIPKIRFRGFTDPWKQRKLWMLTIWDKKFNSVESYKQTKTIRYPYVLADVFNKIEDSFGDVRLLSTGAYIGYTTKEKAGDNLCHGEIVAIPWGGAANVKYFTGFFVTADNRIATSNNTNLLLNKYLYWWMEKNLSKIQNAYRGGSIQHPSMSEILDLNIEIPLKNEQTAINDLFDKLDNLITLHQSKLEKLKNIKKSLLEKMFV